MPTGSAAKLRNTKTVLPSSVSSNAFLHPPSQVMASTSTRYALLLARMCTLFPTSTLASLTRARSTALSTGSAGPMMVTTRPPNLANPSQCRMAIMRIGTGLAARRISLLCRLGSLRISALRSRLARTGSSPAARCSTTAGTKCLTRAFRWSKSSPGMTTVNRITSPPLNSPHYDDGNSK